MNDRTFYLESVLPQVDASLTDAMQQKYPGVRLRPEVGAVSLRQLPVLMLAALTGTGKSTTLDILAKRRAAGQTRYLDDIPARREIADLIAIPTAQVLAGDALRPVKDRVKRFHYTRIFADRVPGGLAAAFSWLYYHSVDDIPIVSEGIRGHREIAFALEECPGWQVMELTLDPVTRLKRLSSRNDAFDQANGRVDMGFLPELLRGQASAALLCGKITPEAITIMQAESANYGLMPYDRADRANYRCLAVDGLSAGVIADAVEQRLERQKRADH
jgi:hypothetical protein